MRTAPTFESLLCAAMLALAAAQTIGGVRPAMVGPANLTVTDGGTCVKSTTGCVVLGLGGFGTVGVQVTGTWTGTLSFECSITGSATAGEWTLVNMVPTNSATPVTTTTGNGLWSGTCHGSRFRLRASAAMTGTAVATLQATLAPQPLD